MFLTVSLKTLIPHVSSVEKEISATDLFITIFVLCMMKVIGLTFIQAILSYLLGG